MKKSLMCFFLSFNLLFLEYANAAPDSRISVESKREEKAKQKVLKKFDRQIKQFQQTVTKLLAKSSEEKLQSVLSHYRLYQRSSIKELGLIDQKIEQALSLGLPLTDVLEEMTTEKFKQKARKNLEDKIQKAGAQEVLKSMRKNSDFNWCILGKIVGGILVAPAAMAAMGSMIAIGFFPFYDPLIWAFVGAALASGGIGFFSVKALEHSCSLRTL